MPFAPPLVQVTIPDSTSQPSPQPGIGSPEASPATKRIKVDLTALSFNEPTFSPIFPDPSSLDLTALEQTTVNILESSGSRLGPSCPDHLCLYNSLSYLISLTHEHNQHLTLYILRQLQELLQGGSLLNTCAEVPEGLIRNLLFIGLQSAKTKMILLGYLNKLSTLSIDILRSTIQSLLMEILNNQYWLNGFYFSELWDQSSSSQTQAGLLSILEELINQEHSPPGLTMAIAHTLHTLFNQQDIQFAGLTSPLTTALTVATQLLPRLKKSGLTLNSRSHLTYFF